MTTTTQHAILSFGEHKLCIAINPEIESDRGFIRFFNGKQILGWSEQNIVNATELNGNSFFLESSLTLIEAINNSELSIIEDKNAITNPRGGSWYNSQQMDSSVCFFFYMDSNDKKQKVALVDMHNMDSVSDRVNIDNKLANDILTGTVYALSNELIGKL